MNLSHTEYFQWTICIYHTYYYVKKWGKNIKINVFLLFFTNSVCKQFKFETQILIESDSNKYWVQNLFFNFFFKILIDLVKNDNKSSNNVQIHELGHFLGKNMTLLNLYLILLLEWSIVPFFQYYMAK